MVYTRTQRSKENTELEKALAASKKDASKHAPASKPVFKAKKAKSTPIKPSRKRKASDTVENNATPNLRPPKRRKVNASKIVYKDDDETVSDTEADDNKDLDFRFHSNRTTLQETQDSLRKSGRQVVKPKKLSEEQTNKRVLRPLPLTSLRRMKANGTKSHRLFLTVRRVKYWRIPLGTLRKIGIRSKRLPQGYWPFPDHQFRLGHNAWEHTGMPTPKEDQVREVHRRLTEYNASFSVKSFVGRPAHATETASVDNLIQTILSQSTGNLSAIDSHSRLCNAFPFTVDGKKHAGKMPNWHAIRLLSQKELERILKPAGYQIVRAKAIKTILDTVWRENVVRSLLGEVEWVYDFNPPNAADFVPGLLSIDYLDSPKDISNNDLLGKLLAFPLIGPKSAMCIMDFAYKRPSFAVDTHVLRFCQWLGWVPPHASEEQAAMFLHNVVPDDIKFDLHNQIWTHCANESTRESENGTLICPFCGANPPPKGKTFTDFNCPVADLLMPLSKRWLDRNGKSRYQELSQDDLMAMREKEAAKEERRQSQEAKKLEKDEAESLNMIDKSLTQTPFAPDSEASQTKAKVKKWARTLDYVKMTPEEAKTEGYLLWEFRPLDNSFMQDWGTFGQLPRYKWEKPDIMDPAVAVTPKYADAVLAGQISHKWMRSSATEADIMPAAALTAVAEDPMEITIKDKEVVTKMMNESAVMDDAFMQDS